MKVCSMMLTIWCLVGTAAAQKQDSSWNGKRFAVVLTYDDAIPQHLDNARPVLDSLGLKATFYVTADATKGRVNDWRRLAQNGHELGNHTLFHPCAGGKGREWVQPERDLNRYTVRRLIDEIDLTNTFLEAIDGKTRRTFAYTCGDTRVNDTSYVALIQPGFVAARGVSKQLNLVGHIDLYNVNCHGVNGESAAEMIEWVKQAREKGALLVLLFHGVGGGNGLNVTTEQHRALLQYLQAQQDVWVAPMIEVADYINAHPYFKH